MVVVFFLPGVMGVCCLSADLLPFPGRLLASLVVQLDRKHVLPPSIEGKLANHHLEWKAVQLNLTWVTFSATEGLCLPRSG